MKRIQEKFVLNDYLKRNLTVQEIAKYRKIRRQTVSNILKDANVLQTFWDKKNTRKNFNLSHLPYELRNHSYFYVYGLVDPFTDEVFYIGKGKAERYRDHFYETKNILKKAKIEEITSKGGDVLVKFYAKQLTEEAALQMEMSLIQSTEGILNILRK